MAYCTASALRAYLSDDMGLEHDDLLTDLIERAQQVIDTQTGRTFEADADTTRYVDYAHVDGSTLYLDADLCSITSVVNNADGGAAAETLEVDKDYIPLPRHETPYYAIKLLASSGRAWKYTNDPENAVSITGRWAYSTTAPADVVQACIVLAGWMYRRRDAIGTDTDRPLATGDGVVILDASVPSLVKDVIRRYRRVSLWG